MLGPRTSLGGAAVTMADKPLKSLNGKKLTGALATPIDTGLHMPLGTGDEGWPEYLKARGKILHDQRMAKMVPLARHLGIDVDFFGLGDPQNGIGLAMLYAAIAETLASMVIPGFQEAPRGKNPREIVRFTRTAIDLIKRYKPKLSDLDACKEILKLEDPKLSRSANRSELDKKAKSLRNLVSKDRADVHKKERDISVKRSQKRTPISS